jgi:hypothetical protein
MEICRPLTSRFAAVLLMLGGSLVWVCSTRAAVETFTVSQPPMLAEYAEREIQIPQFAPSLGSLRSVTLDLEGTGVFFQGFDHVFRGQRQLSMQQPLTLVLETSTDERLITLSQPANHSFNGGAAGNSAGRQNDRVRMAGETTLTSGSDLMQFTGAGLVDLFLSAHSGLGTHFTAGQGILNGFWVAGASIRVTYDFTVIPEASRWWLGDCALLVLACATAGVSSRRRSGKT